MFAGNFKYEEQAVVLKSGLYSIKLDRPYEIKVGGCKAIKFPFTVDGMECKTYPNYFLLQKSYMYDELGKAKKLLLKELMIRQCFILTDPFDEENYGKCVGKRGKVTVMQDKTGYMHVVYFLPNKNIKPQEKDKLRVDWIDM